MLLKKFKILGHSMEKTLKNGDIVLASSIPYIFTNPKINDIVAISIKDKVFVKRIKKVINKKYKVEGDNVNDSFDSKNFGLILRQNIIGKIIYKV